MYRRKRLSAVRLDVNIVSSNTGRLSAHSDPLYFEHVKRYNYVKYQGIIVRREETQS